MGKLKTKVKLCLFSWLAGVLVMAEEMQEGSAVTGRRRSGKTRDNTLHLLIIQLK